MKTYKYHFPASGNVEDAPAFITSMLESRLRDSPDCMGAYCMFPTDSVTLDRVTFNMDDIGNIYGVNLYTYTELWEGREDDLKDCVQTNLNEIMRGVVTLTGDVEKTMQAEEEREDKKSVSRQTYQYSFATNGRFDDDDKEKLFLSDLEANLKSSEDCLMCYCCFPTDGEILDHVSIDKDPIGNIERINLHTYSKVWDGCEEDMKNCVESNLITLSQKYFAEDDVISITNKAHYMGLEGSIPETLYHIAERDDLENIKENGLIPQTGSNNYNNMEDYVYLAELHDIAPWLAILKHLDDPVILEVDTKGLPSMEQGRVFNDRIFVGPDNYSEYRTTEPIPASRIKEAELTDEFFDVLYNKLFESAANWEAVKHDPDKLNLLTHGNGIEALDMEAKEVTTGITRLNEMYIAARQDREFVQAAYSMDTPDTGRGIE